MDLKVYDVIKKILISNKTSKLRDTLGKLTFEVQKDANKTVIKDAVEKIWNVKVEKVCVINIKGKNRTFGKRSFQSPDKKKAIVTLKEGYTIDLPQFETMGVPSEAAKSTVSGKVK